jgi:hypothetical protein
VWALNGKAFTWKDQPAYKVDYYKKVAEPFQQYFDSINIGGAHAVNQPEHSSAILFDNDNASERSYFEAALKKQIALEKWAATMAIIAGGQTKDSIRMRRIVGETITGTRSQTEFERQQLDAILRSLQVLLALENRLKLDSPSTEEEIKACCAMAVEDVDHPGKNATLLEAMLVKSVENANGKRGPQPVVAVIDAEREPIAMPF